MKLINIALLTLSLFFAFPRPDRALEAAKPPAIVFLSDFGTADDSASQCKGVMESVLPGARVVDMTHDIPPYDIHLAAFYLADSALVWPAGTVFVAVVDPGVGTARKSAALRTKSGHYFVGPDNGIFTLVMRNFGVDKIVSIENSSFTRQAVTTTFHGRDVYAPAAAWLARDPSVLEAFGPPLAAPVTLDWPVPAAGPGAVTGSLLRVETPYGNVWTDIEGRTLRAGGLKEGDTLTVGLDGRVLQVPFVRTFGDVPKGAPLAYINSRGLFSLALNMENFSEKYAAAAGQLVSVSPVRR
ncbi:MAG: SAM-dependent chlorinase/fluorinase [Elusimicrobia bacterium]|nr:SAM-dependent chlorinase/fluorinase [Elusimicrobiota bacterium]